MRPSCTILGGANGSGKSSIYDAMRPVGVFVNADTLARQIDPHRPEDAAAAAGRRVLDWLADLVRDRNDFVFETTLSGHQPLRLMKRAREAGYAVRLIFVVLQSADLHIDRVAQRVSLGGHDIATPIILRRYESALTRLPDAIRIAEEVVVVDNTSRKPAVLLRIEKAAIIDNLLDFEQPVHARLARLVATAFSLHERIKGGS